MPDELDKDSSDSYKTQCTPHSDPTSIYGVDGGAGICRTGTGDALNAFVCDGVEIDAVEGRVELSGRFVCESYNGSWPRG